MLLCSHWSIQHLTINNCQAICKAQYSRHSPLPVWVGTLVVGCKTQRGQVASCEGLGCAYDASSGQPVEIYLVLRGVVCVPQISKSTRGDFR